MQQLQPLRYLLLVTHSERLWYGVLSLAAGLCEEWIYRLLLLLWLSMHVSPLVAVLVGGVAIGCAHLYQCVVGVVRASVAGLMHGAVYVLLGSWASVVVLHAVADLQVLVLYPPMVDASNEAKRLARGCKLSEDGGLM